MRIHISETTKQQLAAYPYTVEEHSTLEIKVSLLLYTQDNLWSWVARPFHRAVWGHTDLLEIRFNQPSAV